MGGFRFKFFRSSLILFLFFPVAILLFSQWRNVQNTRALKRHDQLVHEQFLTDQFKLFFSSFYKLQKENNANGATHLNCSFSGAHLYSINSCLIEMRTISDRLAFSHFSYLLFNENGELLSERINDDNLGQLKSSFSIFEDIAPKSGQGVFFDTANATLSNYLIYVSRHHDKIVVSACPTIDSSQKPFADTQIQEDGLSLFRVKYSQLPDHTSMIPDAVGELIRESLVTKQLNEVNHHIFRNDKNQYLVSYGLLDDYLLVSIYDIKSPSSLMVSGWHGFLVTVIICVLGFVLFYRLVMRDFHSVTQLQQTPKFFFEEFAHLQTYFEKLVDEKNGVENQFQTSMKNLRTLNTEMAYQANEAQQKEELLKRSMAAGNSRVRRLEEENFHLQRQLLKLRLSTANTQVELEEAYSHKLRLKKLWLSFTDDEVLVDQDVLFWNELATFLDHHPALGSESDVTSWPDLIRTLVKQVLQEFHTVFGELGLKVKALPEAVDGEIKVPLHAVRGSLIPVFLFLQQFADEKRVDVDFVCKLPKDGEVANSISSLDLNFTFLSGTDSSGEASSVYVGDNQVYSDADTLIFDSYKDLAAEVCDNESIELYLIPEGNGRFKLTLSLS